ncbi:MAG: hypothetical protein E7453_03170 [Ruminococcaceae bacterium]|nr:hypothetical protein [Oscillospiraceae bacterium]
MKKNLLAFLLAAVMIVTCVLIAAPVTKADAAAEPVVINDFSVEYTPEYDLVWGAAGSGTIHGHYPEHMGATGCLALGATNESYHGFLVATADFSAYETVTLRLYVKEGTKAVYWWSDSLADRNASQMFGFQSETWFDYTIDASQLGTQLWLRLASQNWGPNAYVWVDSIFLCVVRVSASFCVCINRGDYYAKRPF